LVTAHSTAVPSEEIPEIVVTAQKREQLAQDIAISISAIDQGLIDAGEYNKKKSEILDSM
jgi:outer membrane receptor protein involved in Fe transport